MTAPFFGSWCCQYMMAHEFGTKEVEKYTVEFALYSQESYDGSAYVLLRRYDDKGTQLYDVEAGHCSCDGLEEQFVPKPTNIPAVRLFIENDYIFLHEPEAKAFLKAKLDTLERQYPELKREVTNGD